MKNLSIVLIALATTLSMKAQDTIFSCDFSTGSPYTIGVIDTNKWWWEHNYTFLHTFTGEHNMWQRFDSYSMTHGNTLNAYTNFVNSGFNTQVANYMGGGVENGPVGDNGFLLMSMMDPGADDGAFNSYVEFTVAFYAPLPTIEFYQILHKSGNEHCYIDYSANGSVWYPIEINVTGIDVNAGSSLSGRLRISLPPSCGYQAALYIRIRYASDTKNSNNMYGSFWAIDDFRVTPNVFVTTSVNDTTMGSATVNGESSITICGGTDVRLTATANEGYHFVRWNDNNTEATRLVTALSDMSFTAYFEADGTEGIDDIEADDIRIYSIDGRIVIEGAEGKDVTVYDLEGRIVRNESLPTGVYLVKVGDIPTRRVVVLR